MIRKSRNSFRATPTTPTARASQERHLFHGAARPLLDEDEIAALYAGRRYDADPSPLTFWKRKKDRPR